MARLYLFAEGQTEQTFANAVLKPHLANSGVYLQYSVLIAHARKKGTVHRGGGRKYEPMKNDITRFLSRERGRDVFFTTMIDLYAIHADFPKLRDSAIRPKSGLSFWNNPSLTTWVTVGSYLTSSCMNMRHTCFLIHHISDISMADTKGRLLLCKK
jgi:hypothetical protein